MYRYTESQCKGSDAGKIGSIDCVDVVVVAHGDKNEGWSVWREFSERITGSRRPVTHVCRITNNNVMFECTRYPSRTSQSL
jgi:hypothetical protein